MRYLITFFIVLTFIIIILAPVSYAQKEHVYSADFNTVWAKIIKLTTQNNLTIKTIEKDSGMINTDFAETSLGKISNDKHNSMVRTRYRLSFVAISISEEQTQVFITPYIEVPETVVNGIFGSSDWTAFTDKDNFLQNVYFEKLDKILSAI